MNPTHQQVLDRFDRSFAVVDNVVRELPGDAWQRESPCPGWTGRDVLAHLLWGQALIAAWAEGEEPPPPGLDHAVDAVAVADLPSLWLRRRAETRTLLEPAVLDRAIVTRLFGPTTLGQFVWSFPNDALLHAWDLARTGAQPIDIPDDLALAFLTWGRENEALLRRPGGFGPEVHVSAAASTTHQWVAFSGRRP